MATTKKSGKKGGAAKKGGSKKRSSSKKGGSLSSVLSNIGSIAGTVGAVAGAAGSLAGGRKGELRVATPRDASFNEIVTALRRKFKDAGHPGCRSGFDRFVFEDIVAGRGR